MKHSRVDQQSTGNSSFNASRSNFWRAGTLCSALLLCAFSLPAEQPGWDDPWDVRLELQDDHLVPFMTLAVAQTLASRMLRTAGVRAQWTRGRLHPADYDPGCSNAPLSVKVFFASPDPARDSRRKGLAYTYPYDTESRRIIVSYSRVSAQVGASLDLSSTVLAHILVHEIAHLLERTEHHSHSGVMKAVWNLKDYCQMKYEPLPFEPEDLELIRLGRKSWAQVRCGETRSSPETAAARLER